MYISIPIGLSFHPNDYKHTKHTIEFFASPIRLVNSVKACVAETYDDAVQDLIRETKDNFISLLFTNHPTLEYSDFSIYLSCEHVKDGKFWAGASCGYSYQLKN